MAYPLFAQLQASCKPRFGASWWRFGRAESAVTVKWIVERLQMGTPGYVNLLLYRQRKKGKAKYANIKN